MRGFRDDIFSTTTTSTTAGIINAHTQMVLGAKNIAIAASAIALGIREAEFPQFDERVNNLQVTGSPGAYYQSMVYIAYDIISQREESNE
jgi:hypothetical protein